VSAPRIALIHALAHSVAPINDALAREWPEVQRMNLLDDSLSADVARSGRLDDAMTGRFLALGDYAVATGADAILFTCSAFGPCIEAVQRRLAPLPVLKPNEAMIGEAVAQVRANGGCVGLLATFAPTLASMQPEFPASVPLRSTLAAGALEALDRGDAATHNRLVMLAAQALKTQGCTVIALAQFSLARAQALVAETTGLPVLTTPDSAVRALRRQLAAT
jgi:Asp/Glu/hydantoin racemase